MAAQTGGNGFPVKTAGAAPEVLNVVSFHTIEFINGVPNVC